MQSRSSWVFLSMLFLVVSTVNGSDSRKLDESGVTVPAGEKCEPCGQTPPPPSPPSLPPPSPSPPPPSPPPPLPPPPSPCPPPPSLTPPSPHPPSPKKPPPSSYYSPPPPGYIYITGPPGNLYPVSNFSGVTGNLKVGLSVLIECGLLGLLGFL